MLEWLGIDTTIIGEIVKQAPQLAILCWLVSRFIAVMEKMSRENKTAIREVNESCHSFQRDMTDKTTKSIDANTHAFGRIEPALDRLAMK